MRGRWIQVLLFEGVDEDGALVRSASVTVTERLPAPRVDAERNAAIEVAPTRPTVRKASPLRLLGSRKAAA